jgi:hypothetical protein
LVTPGKFPKKKGERFSQKFTRRDLNFIVE